MGSKRRPGYRLPRATRRRQGDDTLKIADSPDAIHNNVEQREIDNDTNEATKLAKSADDLDAIRKSVEDASSISAGLWLS